MGTNAKPWVGQAFRHFLLIVAAALLVAASSPVAWAAPYADYVIDARSGEVLHETNAHTRLHPASLTKMMTLYIAFEAIKHGEITLDTMVTVSRNAASEPPSRLGLRTGQKIALRYLIRAASVRSANDAATAIGEAISGSESAFAARMTRTARAIGMAKTTFRNANGLTREGHLSTAHDMAILGRQLFFDHPEYYNLFSRRSTDAGVATVYNTNRRFLDAYRGADGIKTGFTNAAGFNLVASARRGDERIIAAIFGGTSTNQRNARMAELLDLGFRQAPSRALVRAPAPPDYAGVRVASAGAGRSVRGSGIVARSPRPPARPPVHPPVHPVAEASPVLVAALQAGIDDALAAPTAAPSAGDGAPLRPESTPRAAVPEGAPIAPPEADDGARTPMALAGAGQSPAPADDIANLAGAVVAALGSGAGAASPAAEQRREDTAARADEGTDAAVAAADAPAPPPDGGLPLAAADAPPERPGAGATQLAPGAPPAAITPAASAPAEATPAEATPAEATPVAPPQRLAARAPAARPEALAAALTVAMPAELVVVERLSSSGGRLWGVNLGRFPTRFDAERTLLRIALAEARALDGGLRKVVPRGGGFDAQFAGLTRDQADLACRRLQARAQTCFAISP